MLLNNSTQPLVSVIIPAYNAEKFISQTLDSVLHQTYQCWECIIVDDGSTDLTQKIINDHCARDSRFHFFQGQHGGVSRARNLAVEHSNGEYIALLDHDDIWHCDKLEKQIPLFLQDAEVGLVYSNAYIEVSGGTKRAYFESVKPAVGWVFNELIKCDFIICQSAVMKRDCLMPREFVFPPEFEIIEEYELFLWLSLRYKFACVFEPLVTYMVHGNNDSLKRTDRTLAEMGMLKNKLMLDPLLHEKGLVPQLKTLDRLIAQWTCLFEWRRGNRKKVLMQVFKSFEVKYFFRHFIIYLVFPYRIWSKISQFIYIKKTAFFA